MTTQKEIINSSLQQSSITKRPEWVDSITNFHSPRPHSNDFAVTKNHDFFFAYQTFNSSAEIKSSCTTHLFAHNKQSMHFSSKHIKHTYRILTKHYTSTVIYQIDESEGQLSCLKLLFRFQEVLGLILISPLSLSNTKKNVRLVGVSPFFFIT